jgi:uncharacterized protein
MSTVAIATLIFLLGALLTWALAVALFAHGLTHPPRMTDGKAVYLLGRLSPADLGMEFQDLKFQIANRKSQIANPLTLAAWWIPTQNSTKTVLLLHGFADAKVGVIAWAPPWRELGYNILAVDLRAHGESTGKLCTAGHFEHADILALIDQFRAEHPRESEHLAIFGVSLGAAVAALVASKRQSIDAIVLDSPFATYRDAVITHAGLLHQPAKLIAPAALWLVEKVTGANFSEIAPARVVPQIKCPLLILAGSEDLFFYPSAFDPHHVHLFPGAGHLLAFTSAPDEYRQTLKDFLNEPHPPPGD